MRTRVTVTAILTTVLLTACGVMSDGKSTTSTGSKATTVTDASGLTAAQAADQLALSIPQLEVTVVYDKDSDPGHLLGTANGYTSKVAFSDGRIPKSDTGIFEKGDIEVGGVIEVFADAAGAKARVKYLQSEAKGMTAQSEYDYVQGATLIRVSHYLTPTQAKEYETLIKQLS
jgi:hypothetical protein